MDISLEKFRSNGHHSEIKTEKIGEVSLVGPLQESTCLAKMMTKRHIYVNYMLTELSFLVRC